MDDVALTDGEMFMTAKSRYKRHLDTALDGIAVCKYFAVY